MIVTFEFENLAHLKPDQFGMIVAWIMKARNFHSVTVSPFTITVMFQGMSNADSIGEISHEINRLIADVKIFQDTDAMACTCGCGAFLTLTPCMRQVGTLDGELTAEEHAKMKSNPLAKFPVIKAVRIRTGLGLRDAKDLVEKYYPKYYP